MNKKATLLIKNLEVIYTLDKHVGVDGIVHHASIAIHHDEILQIDHTIDQTYLDKDTRILDARGHFAIPAFIEVKPNHHQCEGYPQALQDYVERMNYFHHGITTIALPNRCHSYLEQEIVPFMEHASYPIVDATRILVDHRKMRYKQFCISTYHKTSNLYDSLLLARILHLRDAIDSMTLLKALSFYPAKRLGLRRVGMLKKGYQADLLLCKGNKLEDLFITMEGKGFDQIIKRGIRVFPSVIRS